MWRCAPFCVGRKRQSDPPPQMPGDATQFDARCMELDAFFSDFCSAKLLAVSPRASAGIPFQPLWKNG